MNPPGGDWVALLGVKGGPAIRPGSNMPTATLVSLGGTRVLVDAGLGAARGVCDLGVSLTALDAIVVTHLHSDHYLELGPLLHTAWTAGLDRSVPVIGPPGLADYWRHFLAAMQFDVRLRIEDEGRPELAPLADVRSLEGGQHRFGGVVVEAMRNDHPPVEDSFAVRLRSKERTVVLSGDTAPMDAMVEFARGADLLVHEAMLVDGVDRMIAGHPSRDGRLREHIVRSHTPAHEVGRIAAEADVKALALHHLVPDGVAGIGEADWEREVRRHYAGPLHVGTDGLVIAL